ncbi:MAG: hypothetical protein NW208_11210 [Bryobacter sp.]|nr:hypothetical protein [Bryobacter sp.]
MNPKLLLAFAAGAVVAGAVAMLVVSNQPSPAPAPNAPTEVAQTLPAPVAESPVLREEPLLREEPVAAPEPEPALKPNVRPRPKPVSVKPVPAPQPAAKPEVKPAPQPVAEPKQPEPVTLPPFSSSPTPAPPPAAEEVRSSPVFKPEPAKAVARVPETVTLPEGTSIVVRLNSTLSSDKNLAGDTFTGTLDQPIVVGDMVIAERGARVDGKVMDAQKAGRVKGVSQLSLALTRLRTSDGQNIAINTDPFLREGEKSTKSDAAKIGIGAAIGAAIGAIAGGGKGAGVGAATGAGAGTGAVLIGRGKPVQLDVETKIPFRLAQSVKITEKISEKIN